MCCWFCRCPLCHRITLARSHSTTFPLSMKNIFKWTDTPMLCVRISQSGQLSCFCAIHLPNRYSRAQAHRFYICFAPFFSSLRFVLLWMMEWEIQLLAHRISWFENLFLRIDTENQPLNHCNVLTMQKMYLYLKTCVVRMKTNPIEHEHRHRHHQR